MRSLRPLELTIGALFICLMTVGANITVWLPFLTVPIGGATVPVSLQTFFAIIAGMMLGKKLGSISIFAYILVGLSGLPIFAGLKGGPYVLASPTGGFLLSFILVAFIVGWLTERKEARVFHYTFAASIGVIVNYLFGVTYLYLASNTWMDIPLPYFTAWAGMVPFLIKDAALSFLAAVFMIQLTKRIPSAIRKIRA